MKLILSTFLLLSSTIIFAQGNYNYDGGLAVQGYDVVSYFTTSKAIKGNKNYTYEYNGGTYRFSSSKNLETFKKNPSKYEPAYGGWCAYAYGVDASKVKVNPETFKVTDGRLFLFYNSFPVNTLPKWKKDEKNLIKTGDQYWAKRSK